jgi:C-terminal processing protease CtpA/Prc
MVAAFLSGLKDSHVFFEPPYRPYRLDNGFRMELIGNDAFVTRVRPGTDAEAKVHSGDKIIGYDRYSVNRDDFQDLSYTFNTLMPQTKTQLDLRDPDGKDREVIVESKVQLGRKTLDFTEEGGGDDIWQYIRAEESADHVVRQRWVEIGDVMIWKMPEFFLENEGVDHIFDTARKHQALILDLRQNPGGAVTTLERMVGNVMDHDVKISDRVGRKEMKAQIAKSVGDRAFKGKLIVLVDSQSASAAELFARVVQLEHRGIVLGDKTSGSVMEAKGYSYSQGVDTIIAYGFSITDADLIMKDGTSLEHVGVTPDELILPTGRDLATGQDPVMARAVELAGGKLDPAQAGKLFPYEWLPL